MMMLCEGLEQMNQHESSNKDALITHHISQGHIPHSQDPLAMRHLVTLQTLKQMH